MKNIYVDIASAAAIFFEDKDEQISIDLMSFSLSLRPHGPFLNKKFEQYSKRNNVSTDIEASLEKACCSYEENKNKNIRRLIEISKLIYPKNLTISGLHYDYPQEELIDYKIKYYSILNCNEGAIRLHIDKIIDKYSSDKNFIGEILRSEVKSKRFSNAIRLISQSHNSNRNKSYLLSKLLVENLIESDLFCVLKLMSNEEFNSNESTILSDSVYALFHKNKRVYDKSFSYLKRMKNELCQYDQESLGLSHTPSFLRTIYATGNLSLIKYFFSSHPNHIRNMRFLKNEFNSMVQHNLLVKRHYLNIFNEDYDETIISAKKRKLKIAVCISGQARGYKKAHQTWGKLFDCSKHDFDFYCCLWDKVGSKPIVIPQLDRHFNDDFVQLYLNLVSKYGELAFSNLHRLFDNEQMLSLPDIEDVYNPKKIRINKSSDFLGMSGMYCMHFMIEEAFNMIDAPENYDLIVRIRPDKPSNKVELCWNRIYQECIKGTVYVDSPSSVHTGVGIVIGDQFAVSIPKIMTCYSKTFSAINNGEYPFSEYKGFRAHMSLALSLLDSNIKIKSTKEVVSWGRPIDAVKPNNVEVYNSIKKCGLSESDISKFEEILIKN